jgi:hypothetical protein
MNFQDVDNDMLSTFPVILRAVVKALGTGRAKEFLVQHGGKRVYIPQAYTPTLGLDVYEIERLRNSLANHLDALGNVFLPKADKIFIWERNSRIRRERECASITELASRYRLSIRQIVNICRAA